MHADGAHPKFRVSGYSRNLGKVDKKKLSSQEDNRTSVGNRTRI